MDPELKAELRQLGLLPEEMDDAPEEAEVCRDPAEEFPYAVIGLDRDRLLPERELPHYISVRTERIFSNAQAMYEIEQKEQTDCEDYISLELSVRQDLADLKPYFNAMLGAWAVTRRMFEEGENFKPKRARTGVKGVNRDLFLEDKGYSNPEE